MSSFVRHNLVLIASAVFGLGAIVPASMVFAFDADQSAAALPRIPAVTPDQARSLMVDSMVRDEGQQIVSTVDSSEIPAQASTDASNAALDSELECVAKVVHHEAANQSRRGQLAVAQLIVNRTHSGRFPQTLCGVANQPGQFFQTGSYNPRRDTPQWATAVAVAREARDGATEAVVPGAIFYHAAYQATPRFFKSRQRVMTLGDHVFYR